MLLKLRDYVFGRTGGPAANAKKLEGPGYSVYFSYETPIAFSAVDNKGTVPVVTKWARQNVWSLTSGKHINAARRDMGGSIHAINTARTAEEFQDAWGKCSPAELYAAVGQDRTLQGLLAGAKSEGQTELAVLYDYLQEKLSREGVITA